MSAEPEQFIQNVVKRSWGLFIKDPVLYIIDSLIVTVLGTITLGILAPALIVGFIKVVQNRQQGKPADTGTLFGGLGQFVPSLIAGIVIAIGVSIGTMLFVIPGLFVAIITGFTFHFMALENTGIGDSLARSYRLVMDNLVPVLILGVVIAIINGVGSAVVIGWLLTMPFSMIVTVVAFQELRDAA